MYHLTSWSDHFLLVNLPSNENDNDYHYLTMFNYNNTFCKDQYSKVKF